ncbi:MAG: bifunctional demethylmenaquinone methyltransferase/2-methoxy-6-polyprenyl-1,4-benzoquinol methylase UbiE [candidate division Zixibacteria bacterium]|nr:bifunctional demethylmenaquinone methyltransferase/2-methoxy-6-polyprenyl-1,4-benzoquinol methylase UbiE [candidate division Zixibacteria bacterium]
MNKKKNSPNREKVWEMFNKISSRYDLLNRMLSFGQDIRWRKKVSSYISKDKKQHLLDLATGTGDLMLTIVKDNKSVIQAVGLDMADKMLLIGQKKISDSGLDNKIQMVRGNVENIPFESESYDIVTIAFGIRNVVDLQKSLNEIFRVTKNNGQVLILEFSLPSNKFIRKSYLFYFRYILPLIGSVISGDSYAYRYLNETVETFPYGEQFCELMKEVGFNKVKLVPLTFGVASIYIGEKSK